MEMLAGYPEINIVREMFHSSAAHSNQDDRRVLLTVQESLLKRVFRTFFEEDLNSALRELQTCDNNATKTLAGYLLRIGNFLRPPNRQMQTGRDWTRGAIRVICWHPNTFKLAVAATDDCIRIYTDMTAIIPQLKCGQQRGITSLSWRPFTAGELAVGCQNGIVVWSLHSSVSSRPFNNSQLLKVANHYPVSAVEWSSDGGLLVSASPNDSDLMVWDIDYGRHTPLKRVGHPCAQIKWSPDGSKLFSSTVGGVFRVWNTDKWTPERWSVKCGTIQSAAWSPCGLHLLFVTTEDHFIYALKFASEQLFSSTAVPKQAIPVADLNNLDDNVDHSRPTNSSALRRPQTLAWDPTGRFLAVSDASEIVLFRTSITSTNLNLSPADTIRGVTAEEFPTQIGFQLNKLRNYEAILTIGWSTGRIQYYPFQ